MQQRIVDIDRLGVSPSAATRYTVYSIHDPTLPPDRSAVFVGISQQAIEMRQINAVVRKKVQNIAAELAKSGQTLEVDSRDVASRDDAYQLRKKLIGEYRKAGCNLQQGRAARKPLFTYRKTS